MVTNKNLSNRDVLEQGMIDFVKGIDKENIDINDIDTYMTIVRQLIKEFHMDVKICTQETKYGEGYAIRVSNEDQQSIERAIYHVAEERTSLGFLFEGEVYERYLLANK